MTFLKAGLNVTQWGKREIPERNHRVNSTCWRPFRGPKGKSPKPLAAEKFAFFKSYKAGKGEGHAQVCSPGPVLPPFAWLPKGTVGQKVPVSFSASLSSLSANFLPRVCHAAIVPLRLQNIIFLKFVVSVLTPFLVKIDFFKRCCFLDPFCNSLLPHAPTNAGKSQSSSHGWVLSCSLCPILWRIFKIETILKYGFKAVPRVF